MPVSLPGFFIDPHGDLNAQIGSLEPPPLEEDLRHVTAYFDRLVVLAEQQREFALISFGGGDRNRNLVDRDNPDIQFLARQRGLFRGIILGERTLRDGAIETRAFFAKGNEELPAFDVMLPPRYFDAGGELERALVINFVSGLPSPPPNASLEDIVVFKERHRDQFQAFWGGIFRMADEASCFGRPDAIEKMTGILEHNLEDYRQAVASAFPGYVTVTAKFVMGLAPAIAASLTGNYEAIELALVAGGMLVLGLETWSSVDAVPEKTRAMSYAYRVEALT